jgi:hypothetical protein
MCLETDTKVSRGLLNTTSRRTVSDAIFTKSITRATNDSRVSVTPSAIVNDARAGRKIVKAFKYSKRHFQYTSEEEQQEQLEELISDLLCDTNP